MKTSESVAALAAALSKAQSVMQGAAKDRQNPHFRSDYATLASVIEAARTPLAGHGLAVVQGLSTAPGGLVVTTRLLHSSGEWIEDELTVPLAKNDAQGMGSAATYGRRYALSALLGIAQVDDDGNAAVAAGPAPEPVAKPLSAEQLNALQNMRDAALNGTEALKVAWTGLAKPIRLALAGEIDSLKKAAADADSDKAIGSRDAQ
jgi:hypothetical protein